MDDHADLRSLIELEPRPTSPGRARRFIHEFCRPARIARDVCDTAVLLTSELVTNAVLHSRTPCVVEARRESRCLRITVSDETPEVPRPRRPRSGSERGRALSQLVPALATRWGVEEQGGGKAVWFELDAA